MGMEVNPMRTRDEDYYYLLDKWVEDEEEHGGDEWPEDYGFIPPPWMEL